MSPLLRLTHLAILAATPFVIFAVHALLSRLLRERSRQAVAGLSAALASPPLALLLEANLRRGEESLARHPAVASHAVLCFCCIAYAYFHLFNLGETARRIRILREVHVAGILRDGALADAYGRDELVAVRLMRLVETGQVVLRDGRYVLAGRFLHAAARIVQAWRALLGFDRVP